MIKKFLFITLSLVVICFFFIVSCNVSQYDECDEMGGANQLLSAFNVEYASVLNHNMLPIPKSFESHSLSHNSKTTTVYVEIPNDVDINYKPVDEVSTLDDLMVLTHNVGAVLSFNCSDQLGDSIIFSTLEAEHALAPLVKSSKTYLKSKGFTDGEIEDMLAEYNLDDTALVPLVLACAESEINISSISTKQIHRNKGVHTNEITWGGVGDCAMQAIGIDIFMGLSQSTLKTWSKAAIKRAFKSLLPKLLGPVGVAVMVAEFSYCLYNL